MTSSASFSGLELIKSMSSPRRHFIDGVLMGLFIVRITVPGIPAALPLGELAAIALILLAALRPNTLKSSILNNFLLFGAFLGVYLVLISLVSDVDFIKRILKIAMLFLLAGAIAAQKIDLVSGLRGIAIALFINIPLFFSGLTPDTYNGYLTGVIGDKNVAGLYYSVIPLLVLMISQKVSLRLLIIVSSIVALVLTGSRSSLAAFGFALMWLLLAPKLRTFGKIILGIVLLPLYFYINDNFAQFADFNNRIGSDQLRARIDAASELKTFSGPWYGSGLGESQVFIEGARWYFHNSYLALIVEGGYVLLIAIVGLYAVVGLRLFQPKINNRLAVYIETATVALLLCAVRLGEVFFTIPGFLILGIGLAIPIANSTVWAMKTENKAHIDC